MVGVEANTSARSRRVIWSVLFVLLISFILSSEGIADRGKKGKGKGKGKGKKKGGKAQVQRINNGRKNNFNDINRVLEQVLLAQALGGALGGAGGFGNVGSLAGAG